MKEFKEYIAEKANFIVKKHVKHNDSKAVLPLLHSKEDGSTVEEIGYPETDGLYKEIPLKDDIKPFIIYNDKYHHTKHIASLSDMMMTCCNTFSVDDFEDFGPEDIIGTFDTLKEAVEFAFKDDGKELKHYYDSVEWANGVLDNVETTDEHFDVDRLSNGDVSKDELKQLLSW